MGDETVRLILLGWKKWPESSVLVFADGRFLTRQIVNRFLQRFLEPKYSARSLGSERPRLHLKPACHQKSAGAVDAGQAQRTNCTFVLVRHASILAGVV